MRNFMYNFADLLAGRHTAEANALAFHLGLTAMVIVILAILGVAIILAIKAHKK